MGNNAPETSSDSGMPNSISRCTVLACGSGAQPVLRIICRLDRKVVATITAIRTAATIVTMPSWVPKLAAIGAPNSRACAALSNCVSV
ncbi:hypothetical protein KRM28CT15_29900 [Krasilnikovia sp. M28-CT-15]